MGSTPDETLTVEQGRTLLRRAHRMRIAEKVLLGAAAVGGVTFAASIVEMSRIEAVAGLTGQRATPYVAYTGILLFWGSLAAVIGLRLAVAGIARRLDAEQRRRDAAIEPVEPECGAEEAASG